jgi:cellulose synthase (UDP-forming)
VSTTSLTRRASHLTATPADGFSWRPLQRTTRAAVAAAMLASAFYLLFLLNPANRGEAWLWFAILLAEGLTVFQAIGTWWTILAHDDRPESPAVYAWRRQLLDGTVPTIDVFITACGEPLHLVLATIRAARDMRLPHATWVLDDGRSDELRHACAREQVGYLRREGREHAKAGNINAGLALTTGEFVLILDADHVPSPDLLVRTLPHLHDPATAFAQTPQTFPSARGLVATGSAEAQRIFYELVCPGKNSFNAVFCVGTNVIFRRRALDEIGGIYTGSNSEDIWTSLELHRRGWRSVFVREVLARGLAPHDLYAHLKQQFRWSSGGFEVLLRGRLFQRGGLTLDQRLQYLLVGTNYLLSLAVLIFMLVPSAYLLFGWSPIRGDTASWLLHYLPFYVLIILVTWFQCGGFRPSAIVMSIGAAPVHFRALVMVLARRRVSWSVTNVDSDGQPGIELVLPQVAFLLLNLVSIAVGLSTIVDLSATVLSVIWASMQVLILGRVIVEAVLDPRRQQARTKEPKRLRRTPTTSMPLLAAEKADIAS